MYASAIAGTTSSGSLMGASATKQIPSGKRGRRSAATSSAKRVLPTPPGPVTKGDVPSVSDDSFAGAAVPATDGTASGTKSVFEDGTALLASSRAAANACTSSKRSCGSLANALSTTACSAGEIAGILPCKGGGWAKRCWLNNSDTEPEKGRSPHSHLGPPTKFTTLVYLT